MSKVDHDAEPFDKAAAEALAGRICARAAQQAVASCHLLELIGDFDARGGLGYLSGVKSVAHWIAHSCSMAPGVAREHVRIARALRRMPTITAAFRTGELSYSKVREATRLVDQLDEARLCELARATSASQLARTIAGYRAASGTRIAQHDRRRFRLINRDDTMTGLTGELPADEAAIVAAALRRARDLNSTPPPRNDTDTDTADATPRYVNADALRDICQHYLNTATTDDESGEDRSLVIIQIAAEQLLDPNPAPHEGPATPDSPSNDANVPAGTPPVRPAGIDRARGGTTSTAAEAGHDLPIHPPTCPTRTDPDPTAMTPDTVGGTRRVPDGPSLREGICTIRGVGGIEPETARRHLCTGTLLGAIIDTHGDILALGHGRRLASKAQRRALMLRDQSCQYPGCTSSHHLLVPCARSSVHKSVG
ncbi:DUF222 domain-containing protein [Microlunatus speluncae]|uniref:DUF222 domain-containing protein n=1 Tax=Microlunatus speluncae TaxID=2594267 RepID=UPI0012661CC9|nr:DUF222 domain-containing protein [Microlunatus speluncae]